MRLRRRIKVSDKHAKDNSNRVTKEHKAGQEKQTLKKIWWIINICNSRKVYVTFIVVFILL